MDQIIRKIPSLSNFIMSCDWWIFNSSLYYIRSATHLGYDEAKYDTKNTELNQVYT